MRSTDGSPWAPHNQLLDNVVDTAKQTAFWDAQQQHALVALVAEPGPLDDLSEADRYRWLEQEVGAALHLHPKTAGDRIALAERLVHELPMTLKMLENGALTMRHARAAVDATIGLTPEQIVQLEDEVLPEAVGLSVGEFTARLDKAVHCIVPKLMEDQRQQEVDDRGVWAKGSRHGTVTVRATGLAPADAATLMNRLNTMAEGYAAADKVACSAANDTTDRDTPSGDVTSRDTPICRTADQRRADALVNLTTEPTIKGTSPKPPIGINVCIALSTLLGLDEQPGEIDGPGFTPASPITATQARLLAHDPDSTWRRLVTDPLGTLLDYGRTTYRPPTALADYVTARDRTCRSLHCNRTAATCDLDHHHDWHHGGDTNQHNLGPVCRRDHVNKHANGSKVKRLDNGDHQWTTPLGRTYTKPAATYPIDHTTDDPPPF
jgi:hypothetical protein